MNRAGTARIEYLAGIVPHVEQCSLIAWFTFRQIEHSYVFFTFIPQLDCYMARMISLLEPMSIHIM